MTPNIGQAFGLTCNATTLDDLLNQSISAILQRGMLIKDSRKGPNREIRVASLILTQPRARISRTESKGRIFSALGELLWYLSGSDDIEFIKHYIPKYEPPKVGKRILAAYGPRLFRPKSGPSPFARILDLLKKRPLSRRALLPIYEPKDMLSDDSPCTSSLQFLIRDSKLDLVAHMRSNDIWIGLPHDIFAFTMIQELAARSLSVEIGNYYHFVGSLHLYEENEAQAKAYLGEGIQGRQNCTMPSMPLGDPSQSVKDLLKLERDIRNGTSKQPLKQLPPYWADLVILLRIHAETRNKNYDSVRRLRAELNHKVYDSYINIALHRSRTKRVD